MGSDSLEKPGRQHAFVEKFQIQRDKVFNRIRCFKPRSLKPWILIPHLVFSCLTLLWVLVSSLLSLIWAVISNTLAINWSCVALAPQRRTKAYLVVVANSLTEYLIHSNPAHMGFKIFSRVLLALYAWIAIALWYGSPWGPGGQWPVLPDREVTYERSNINNYFNDFKGTAVCKIMAADLYTPPVKTDEGYGYCNSRAALLEALSGGGRHGFDTPYVSRSCHYRWYSVEEICAILDRFDGVVFVGDQNAEMIYAGFNILMRKDLQYGALRPETTAEKLASCACNSQFTDPSCHEWFVRSSREVLSHGVGANAKPYNCERTVHALLDVTQSPAPADTISRFNIWVPQAPLSNYKPVPIIHSLTSEASVKLATLSLDEFLSRADATKRKTPMLWIGPTAAGHIEIKGRKGNQEIWHFAGEMARIAKEKDVETLGLWNLTVQANSYDGKGFGEDVSIVAAMMVVNWLARLESS